MIDFTVYNSHFRKPLIFPKTKQKIICSEILFLDCEELGLIRQECACPKTCENLSPVCIECQVKTIFFSQNKRIAWD